MSAKPLVTVGIPFRDEERFLEAAVLSILAQSYEELEILLVDDGSSDRSLEIARSFDDPRIVVISDGERRCLAARLNEITRRARGAFIARMDADDVAHRERLAREMAVLLSNAQCDAVGCWVGLVDEDDTPFAVVEGAPMPSTLAVAMTRGLFPHATLVARRAWFERFPYDETLTRAEDRDLWCRTVGSTHFEVVPSPLYVVRVRASDAQFLHEYVETQKQNYAIYMRYGPAAMGGRRTAIAAVSLAMKSTIMRVAVASGLARNVVRRRGRPPTPSERSLILDALRA